MVAGEGDRGRVEREETASNKGGEQEDHRDLMREGREVGEGAGEVEVHETVRVSETKAGGNGTD